MFSKSGKYLTPCLPGIVAAIATRNRPAGRAVRLGQSGEIVMAEVTKVRVGDTEYEIGGEAPQPPFDKWDILRVNGRRMTADQFAQLPAQSQDELSVHIETWAKAKGVAVRKAG